MITAANGYKKVWMTALTEIFKYIPPLLERHISSWS